jgi:putative ABC transport system permease protein
MGTEVLRFALRGLGANKLRSALTTLGILIGVGAVILLVAVGTGSSQAVQKSIEQLGTNTLTVMPSTTGNGRTGGGGGIRAILGIGGGANQAPGATAQSGPRTQAKSLTVQDAAAIADQNNAPAVQSVSPVADDAGVTATYDGASTTIDQVVGTYPAYFQANNDQIQSGGYFTNADVENDQNVIVIGQTVDQDLFGTVNPIGKQITVSGVHFTVVGLLKEKGSSGFTDADSLAIAPLPSVQANLTGYVALDEIVVQAKSPTLVDAAQSEVTEVLDQRHDITATNTADFQILNQASLESAVSSSSKTFTVLLGAVAAISLIVGGIGITNIMLVTVTERTREIGIRKAIGAPKGAILGQFLIEATVLSLIGGILGVIAGVVGSQFTVVGVRPVIVPSSIALALGVSVAIGLFFGSYPANRAAKLRPIEALRHE